MTETPDCMKTSLDRLLDRLQEEAIAHTRTALFGLVGRNANDLNFPPLTLNALLTMVYQQKVLDALNREYVRRSVLDNEKGR